MSINVVSHVCLAGAGCLLFSAIVNAQTVACLQEGKMDLGRPEFPSVTCWETLATPEQSVVQLQEACATPFGPWDIKSQVVAVCRLLP